MDARFAVLFALVISVSTVACSSAPPATSPPVLYAERTARRLTATPCSPPELVAVEPYTPAVIAENAVRNDVHERAAAAR